MDHSQWKNTNFQKTSSKEVDSPWTIGNGKYQFPKNNFQKSWKDLQMAYSNFGEEIEGSRLWARLALSAGCRPMLKNYVHPE
jgi:hypothetical protein